MGLKVDPETEAKILALAGQSRPANPTRPTPSAEPVPIRLVVGPIPVRLVSEANAGGKRRAEIARKTAVKAAVRAALPELAAPLTLPVVVVMTRVGIRPLDTDNLARALKAVRDEVAAWLGVDDADRRVRWVCRQRAGWAAGVVIDVRQVEARP